MHALIRENKVVQYPYTVWDLRKDHPNTSFPKNISDEVFSEYGVMRVFFSTPPAITYAQDLKEGTPAFAENRWNQTWIVVDLSPDELAVRKQQYEEGVREQRNQKLAASDWTMLSDAPVTNRQAWIDYRQDLRDVSQQADFPWVVIWPEPPN